MFLNVAQECDLHGMPQTIAVKVRVLTSPDQWYGVTYKEDKESVVSALRSMKDKGFYPEILWK